MRRARAGERVDDPGRRGADARRRDDRHRRRRGRHRPRRHHGRRRHRGERREPGHPARGGLLGSPPDPAHPPRPRPEHRGELPLRARHRPVGRRRGDAALHRARAGDRRRRRWPTRPLDLWPEPSHPPRIFLRPARVAQVLGVELPWARAGAVPGRHRRHRGLASRTTAGSRWTCRAGARTCVARDRSDRGDRPPARLRELSRRTCVRSGWAACPTRRSRTRSAPRCAADWSPQGFYEVVPPAAGPGRRRRAACACSTRSRPTTPGSAGGCSPGWSGWSRPTGPTTSPTCGCSRSAPRSRPARPGERPREERRVAGGAHRPARAGALDRHRRRAVRSLGSQGPVRGRGRSGDSWWRGAG